MTDILIEIVERKRQDLVQAKRLISLAGLEGRAKAAAPVRGFAGALRAKRAQGRYGLIAEIKSASPSGGSIRPDFKPAEIARAYETAGAACLSILTDGPYFKGEPAHLVEARAAVSLPVLRKDFMVDPYQVAQTRAMGADCILLIVAALDDALAAELAAAARDYGLGILTEVHDRAELDRALRIDTDLIGINNRNLKTLKTDIATTEELSRHVPAEVSAGGMLVSESGLRTSADLARMAKAGAGCFLIGESLLRHADIEAATRALLAPLMPVLPMPAQ